jgi:TolA-binding protein
LPKGFTQELHQEPEQTPELEEEEATPQQIAQLDDLQQQIDELEKEIKKSKSTHVKRKIIKPLRKQNKKLDGSTTKKSTLKSNSSQVYCAKCKTKRKIKNPKKTTMKNGRAL